MTADEEFRDWFMLQSKMPYRTPEEIAEMAWFASKSTATKTTAARCVEICKTHSRCVDVIIEVIKKEHGLE